MLSSMLRARKPVCSPGSGWTVCSPRQLPGGRENACDCGYEDVSAATPPAWTPRSRAAAPRYLRSWLACSAERGRGHIQAKYDYHNLKTVLKSRAMGVSAGGILSPSGPSRTERLLEYLDEESGLSSLPADMAEAYTAAESVLNRTGNRSSPTLSSTAAI